MSGPVSRLEGDTFVNGQLSCTSFQPPAGSIPKAAIPSNAGIEANKTVRHQAADEELFGPTTTITALTKWLHIIRGANATAVAFQAAITTAATGGDRTVSVDLQKSSGGGAFATILTAPIAITNGTAIRTAVSGTISSAAMVAGDIVQIVVTVAGAAGNQALGLLASFTFEETYQ
jgi:hypothetical protein